MDKKKNERLILQADEALRRVNLFEDNEKTKIQDSYNGQVAALGVSIAMTGILPTLAIYYQDKPNSNAPRKANRRAVLEIIAQMITLPPLPNLQPSTQSARALLTYAIHKDAQLAWLKKEVIDCSIALKQVIRTYNLVKV